LDPTLELKYKVIKELPLTVSKNALSALHEAKLIYKDLPFIRIGIKGGAGCAGIAYSIGIDNATEKDEIYMFENLKFAIEKGQLMHLAGMAIDYLDSGKDKGFVFNNVS